MLDVELEKIILNKMRKRPRTPASLGKVIEETLQDDILQIWKKYFWGRKKRTWKGIESTARAISLRASFIDQVQKDAKKNEIEAEMSAILLAVPQISGPTWRDRKKREEAWEKIDFCSLCWRLAPAGAVTSRRPVLCEKHEPRTPEYQLHYRLKKDLPAALIKARTAINEAGGEETVQSKLSIKTINALPHLYQHALKAGVDPQSLPDLLKFLLLDVGDSNDLKIKSEVEKWSEGGEWAAGTLLYAEAWLSLIDKRMHGGRRSGAGRPKKD